MQQQAYRFEEVPCEIEGLQQGFRQFSPVLVEAEPTATADVADMPAKEAARRSADVIASFFDRLLTGAGTHVGVRGTVGLGKTAAVIKQLVRPELAGLHVNYYAPEHRLNGELLARFNAAALPGSPKARVVLGRGQINADGEPMCRKADIAAQVQALGKSVQSHLCYRADNDHCEFFLDCPYQRQRADREPGVRFMAHAHLFIGGDENTPPADAVVIDESFWNTSLRGVEGKTYVTMSRLEAVREVPTRKNDGVSVKETADLSEISMRCAKAIKAGGRLWDFILEGVTVTDVRDAMSLEYRRADADKLEISPGMPHQRQQAILDKALASEALRFARFFKLLRSSLAAEVEPKFLRYVPEAIGKGGEIEAQIQMAWSADIKTGGAPALLIDANLDAEIARRFLPEMDAIVEANARLGGYHAVQITDQVVGKSRLVPTDGPDGSRRANRRAELLRLAEVEAAKGKVLLVTYKAAEDALRIEAKALEREYGADFSNVDFAHWNALRGRDQWKDVDTLIVAGRPQPNVEVIERMAEALWYLGEPVAKIDAAEGKMFTKERRSIALADGSRRGIDVDVHPDPRCTLLLDQIRAEVMQAVGRARLVYRQEDRPCRVIILGNLPLPMLVHETSTWGGVMPGPVEVMEARGIILERKRDAAKLLSDMFPNGGLEDWFARNKPAATDWGLVPAKRQWENTRVYITHSPIRTLIGECVIERVLFSHWEEVAYRVKGERCAAKAWVNISRHPDPLAALARVLGPIEVVAVQAPKIGDDEILSRILLEIDRAEVEGEPHTARSLRALAGVSGPLGVNEVKLRGLIKQAIEAGRIIKGAGRHGGWTLRVAAG